MATQKKGDAKQDQALAFSMVFLVLTDFQDTLQQGLQDVPGTWTSVCSDTSSTAQRWPKALLWLCSGSLWPLPLWREAGGWELSSNSNGDNLLFSIISPLSSWRLLKDGCSLLSVWLL